MGLLEKEVDESCTRTYHKVVKNGKYVLLVNDLNGR